MRGREYPDHPLVGVGVAVFNNEKKLLLVQRGQPPSEGLWALPGGLVEVGEELKAAAKRETREECGIEIEIGDIISVIDLILKDQNRRVKYHYILIDYLAEYISGETIPQSDIREVSWFSQQEIDHLDVPEMTRQIIAKAFGNRLK